MRVQPRRRECPRTFILGRSGVETARSTALVASPLSSPRHKSLVYASAGVLSFLGKASLCTQTPPQIHVNMHLNHIIIMIIMKKVTFRWNLHCAHTGTILQNLKHQRKYYMFGPKMQFCEVATSTGAMPRTHPWGSQKLNIFNKKST